MSVLVLGDVHLGRSVSIGRSAAGSALNSRIVDQLNLLDWVYQSAQNNNIKDIVITGDIFEEPKPSHNLISLLIEWLRVCTSYDISVHIIAGNHDILRSGQFYFSPLDVISMACIDNVYVYKNVSTIYLNNIGITLLPFRDRRSFNTDSNTVAVAKLATQLNYELASIPLHYPKVLIGHLAIEGSIPVGYELDELANELFCPINIFKGYDITLMGHVHKYQVLSENPYAAHIGSMDISDFGEADHKKYIAILDPSKKDLVSYVEIPTRSLQQITIAVSANTTNVMLFLQQELDKLSIKKDSIVRVNIKLNDVSSYSINRSIIEKYLYNKGVYHVCRITEEREFVARTINQEDKFDTTVNEVSAIKMYASSVEEQYRNDFVNLANSVINEYKQTSKN